MKKTIVLLSILIIGACSGKNEIPEPKKPIDKEVMENILYDLTLLQALKSYNPEKLKENKINSSTYIYQKYKIDSLQFVENNKYFASKITEYNQMFERVNQRLLKQKAIIDTILKKELKVKTKKTSDSLAKINKQNKKEKIIVRG